MAIFSIFYVIPFLGLAILSNLLGFNYLCNSYNRILRIIAAPHYIGVESSQLSGLAKNSFVTLLLALPVLNIINLSPTNIHEGFISRTEKERGLSSSRFSQAIDYIENDSENALDIIYFLPAGDMGDLVLRTKMKAGNAFAGDNFPQLSHFKTTKELNVYLVYDEKLIEIPNFTSN